MRRFPLVLRSCVFAIIIVIGLAAIAAAQTPEIIDAKIIDDAKANSELIANLTYLSDVIGPRLTGSAALKRANDWTAEKMKTYGLSNVRLEAWSLPEGWERGSATARIIEPENGRALVVASLGWTPGTNGKVVGDVIALNAKDNKELAAIKSKIKGAILLDGPPRTLPTLEEMKKDNDPTRPPFLKKKGEGSVEERIAFMKERANLAKSEGAAVILRDAGKHFGLLTMSGGWRGTDRPSAENRIPALYVAHNHYELLWRLATRPDAKTRLEVEVTNNFIAGPLAVYNTVGEIPGTEKPDEFVVVGAHLDSWDLGSGTTDNGTGTSVILETARLIAKCGVQPKRTIRFVLFTGEEQGLHGARAYTERHKETLDKHSCCIVHDTGPGKVIGLGIGGRPAAQKLLEQELAGLKTLGVTDFTTRAGGGSDHVAFDTKGVPGFAMRQVTRDYFLFTHHSQADTLERAAAPDLIQGAQVTAIMALRIANLPELLPRDKK